MTDAEKIKEIQELLKRREEDLKVNLDNSSYWGLTVLATRYEAALDEVKALQNDVRRIIQ